MPKGHSWKLQKVRVQIHNEITKCKSNWLITLEITKCESTIPNEPKMGTF